MATANQIRQQISQRQSQLLMAHKSDLRVSVSYEKRCSDDDELRSLRLELRKALSSKK